MTERFMNAPGSPSSPLQMTYFFGEFCIRAASHLRPVGKPPPPRPRNPDSRTILQISSGDISTNAFRAATSAQSGLQNHLADLFRRHLDKCFPRRLVAAVQHVFANVFRIEKSAFVQHKPALTRVEGIVFKPSATLARRWILVEQAFHNLV